MDVGNSARLGGLTLFSLLHWRPPHMNRIFVSARRLVARVQAAALVKREEGASLVEYGLLVGLIAVVCIGAITLLGQDISSLFSRLAAKLEGIST